MMIRYINSTVSENDVIYIDYVLTDEKDYIRSDVRDPLSIKEKYRLSTEEINDWICFVDSVVSMIRDYDFDIVDEHQSGKSYSYYISFYPTSEDGRRFSKEIKVVFRLSDHRNEQEHTKSSKTIFKNFEVNGEKYPSTYSVMMAVDRICESLQNGDYAVLDKY